MAKDPKAAEGGEAAAPPPSGKKKLLLIIVAVVVLLVIGLGVGAVLLLKKPAEHAEDDEEVVEVEKPKKSAKKKDEHPPVYVALDPFTVNLVPETGDQYLQVAVSVECLDPAAEAQLKSRMPKIRNGITLLLSGKKASELTSREGKEKLAEEIKESINAVFAPEDAPAPKKGKKQAAEEPEGPVKEVLFTSFIIQ